MSQVSGFESACLTPVSGLNYLTQFKYVFVGVKDVVDDVLKGYNVSIHS